MYIHTPVLTNEREEPSLYFQIAPACGACPDARALACSRAGARNPLERFYTQNQLFFNFSKPRRSEKRPKRQKHENTTEERPNLSVPRLHENPSVKSRNTRTKKKSGRTCASQL